MRNFQGVAFLRIQTFREIFESALVYLKWDHRTNEIVDIEVRSIVEGSA